MMMTTELRILSVKERACFSGESVRNKSTGKIQDPAGIHTQDLLNARQTLLPLKPHGAPGKETEDKLHKQCCLSLIPRLSQLSRESLGTR